MAKSSTTRLNPQKLLLSKWTAVSPLDREKHFLVSKLIAPEPEQALTYVELEAIYSNRKQIVPWRDLTDMSRWLQGWR
jgi:tryptophan-rich hypothetical protein